MKLIQFIFVSLFCIFSSLHASLPKKEPQNLEFRLNKCRQRCSEAAIKSSTAYAICYNPQFPNNTDPYCLERYRKCLTKCAAKFIPKNPPTAKLLPQTPEKSRYFMELYP